MKIRFNYLDYFIELDYKEKKDLENIIFYFKFYEWDKKSLNSLYPILTITKPKIEEYFAPYDRLEFVGKADILINDLKEIIKLVKYNLNIDPNIYLLGYSLGGLFVTYASLKLEIKGIISCSGSLWYPDFYDFLLSQKPRCKYAYFSIGDKETKGRNGLFKNNIKLTCDVSNYFNKFLKSYFVLNEGNHFTDVEKRMEKGINTILSSEEL